MFALSSLDNESFSGRGQQTQPDAHFYMTLDLRTGNSAGKESVCNVGDPGLIPGLGRSSGEKIGYPLQYSGLENSMGCIVHRVTNERL